MATQDGNFRLSGSRRQEARRALLASARRLFLRQGFTETSIDQVVLGAAVARGAFYLEFEDKRDMFRAVVEDELEAIARRMQEVLSDEAEGAFDRLRGLADIFLECSARGGPGRMVFAEGPFVLGRTAWSDLERMHMAPAFESALTSAMKAGEVAALPVEPLASVLRAACQECARALADGEGRPGDFGRVMTHLFSGLRRSDCAESRPVENLGWTVEQNVPEAP